MTITGNKYVAEGATLTVSGDLRIAPGACLDAFTRGTVHVKGSVRVANGAILALGCTPGSIGPVPPCNYETTDDTVDHSIIADHAYTMYLDGDTIGGNVTSIGGGPGATLDPYINFPIKDNTIHGNLTVSGWEGAWFGALRNVIGGKVLLTKNVGLAIGEFGPDSTEIATNTIAGDLACYDNSPAAQLGDSGGTINTVGGKKLGQCTAV